MNFNSPVIVGHFQVPGLEFAPISVMRAFAIWREPGTLRRAIEAQVASLLLDLSDLVEGD